jgi:hypothetical protein
MNFNMTQRSASAGNDIYQSRHAFNIKLVSLIGLLSVTAVNAEPSEKNDVKNDKVSIESRFLAEDKKNQPDQPELAVTPSAADTEWKLYAEQWELTRSGDSILSIPALNQLINQWITDKNKRIVLQYPGGEEGEFWVQELGDWLVSMGIPSNHIDLMVGSGADDMIRFDLMK